MSDRSAVRRSVARPSIFEFAGGTRAFRALAAAHHRRCLADPVLNHPFSHGVHPDHVQHLADYWAEAFGGPPVYSQTRGGHSAMLGAHCGNDEDEQVAEEFGARFVECFGRAADDAGLPSDPEFRAALRAYMRWAVREVFSYAEVPPGLPVPRWSWDGLEDAVPSTVEDAV